MHDYIRQVEDLRLRLDEYLVDHPQSLAQLAVSIGINRHTLQSFMEDSRPTRLITYLRIKGFLRKFTH